MSNLFEDAADSVDFSLKDFDPLKEVGIISASGFDGTMCGRIIKEAEQFIGRPFEPIPATAFLDFVRTGNRVRYEAAYFARRTRLNVLVLAEFIEQKGRFIDDVIDGVFAIAEESGWQLPAHNSYVRDTPQLPLPCSDRPVLDLFSCETGCQLAMIHYLLGRQLDSINTEITARIRRELKARIFDPYLSYKFWWMGYDGQSTLNWTVWCTQNVLIAAFLPGILEDESVRKSILMRAAFSTDRFLDGYGDDGCCSEGAQYYRHAGLCLFNSMEVFCGATGGSSGVFGQLYSNRKIVNIAEYIVNMHAGGPYFFNFSDCAAVAGRCGMREYLFGKRVNSLRLMSFAGNDWLSIYKEGGVPIASSSNETLNLFYLVQELCAAPELLSEIDKGVQKNHQPEKAGFCSCGIEDISYPSTGLYIRKEGAYAFAVKAGGNNDCHNHNDTGSFTLYKNERPFIIDLGVETYSQKTFSARRYEIWTMQSLYHNVSNFEGTMQQDGAEFCAKNVEYSADENGMNLTMDLEGAWPKENRPEKYSRSVHFDLEKGLLVTDSVSSEHQAFFTLITLEKPVYRQNRIEAGNLGTILVQEKDSDSDSAEPLIEKLEINDKRLRLSWPETLYRIRIPFSSRIQVQIR